MSDTQQSQHKSLADQRQLSTSQISKISFDRPQSAATQALLFNPNDVVEENTVCGNVVKQIITLLQRCLKSKNQSIFNAALEQVSDTSDNYGPALNKYLYIIVPLMEKRKDKHTKDKISNLRQTLLENGGEEAIKILSQYPSSQAE